MLSKNKKSFCDGDESADSQHSVLHKPTERHERKTVTKPWEPRTDEGWKRSLHLPMTALGSVPKAHRHGDPDGTWNLEKLHLELKYLGRKLADAKLQRWWRPSQGLVFWPPPSPHMDVKQTSTACSFWGPLRQRCAPCRGHWTHRWATHPDWNWCWKKPKEQFDQTSAGGRVCLLHLGWSLPLDLFSKWSFKCDDAAVI